MKNQERESTSKSKQLNFNDYKIESFENSEVVIDKSKGLLVRLKSAVKDDNNVFKF